MFRFATSLFAATLMCGVATAQQPSGTSPAPAPGTHMDQSTVQTVGTTPNGAGATATAPKPSTNAATAMPSEASTGNSLVASPPQPVTKTLGSGGLVDPSDVADLLAPKPLQPSKLSLIGGTVKSIDQIRDNMTVHVYDSGTMHVKFDQRTHFYRDGKETTQLTVKKGDRVYLDTQLFEGKVFAKNVHVESGSRSADASGQIVSFNRKTGDMVVQDQLAGSAVKFRVDPQTTIKHGDAKTTESTKRKLSRKTIDPNQTAKIATRMMISSRDAACCVSTRKSPPVGGLFDLKGEPYRCVILRLLSRMPQTKATPAAISHSPRQI